MAEDKHPANFVPVEALGRRSTLKAAGVGLAAAALTAATSATAADDRTSKADRPTLKDSLGEFFQDNYQRMTDEEIADAIGRLERKYRAKYDVDITIENTPPLKGVVFGYALNISRCRGYRECVRGCVKENNTSRNPEIQFIRVLEMDKGTMNLETSNHYFGGEKVPVDGKFYLPVQCHQCDNPPCVKACPVKATWAEPDGIVVIDYNWCIGCRFCMAACPYWARHFNWAEPSIPKDQINTQTHYLSNRPRFKGVVEKCFFCLQRTRKGRMPACQEACPTGARVFGNLLDPNSDIRYILENKTVFRLKEDLNTDPKFWYYTD